MGLLDLPAPLFSWLDAVLTMIAPPFARLLLWAAAGALISMELYRLVSPQERIATVKSALEQVRRTVNDFDGPFEEAWPHIRHMLWLAVRRVLLVLPATLLASLPLLVVIVWLDTHYGGMFPPPGASAAVHVGEGFQGRWIDEGNGSPPRAEVLDPVGARIAEVPMAAPVSVVHKRQWWNALIGNPAGYLSDETPLDRIEIALPRQQLISFGPDWLRGWEPVFFVALLAFALALKTVRRIE
jgi:hypothetical protein